MPPGAAPLVFMELLSIMLLLSSLAASTAADTTSAHQVQMQVRQLKQLHPEAPVILPGVSTLTTCSCVSDSCLNCPHGTPTLQQQQQQHQIQQMQPAATSAHQSTMQVTAPALSENAENNLQQQQQAFANKPAAPAGQSAAADDAGHESMHTSFAQPDAAEHQQQQNLLQGQQTWTATAVAAVVGGEAPPNNEPTSAVLCAVEQQPKQQHFPLHHVFALPAGSGKQTTDTEQMLSSPSTILAAAPEQQQPDTSKEPLVGMQGKAAAAAAAEEEEAAAADASGAVPMVPMAAAQANAVQQQQQQQQHLLQAAVAVQPPPTMQHLQVVQVAMAAAQQQQQQQQQLPQQTAHEHLIQTAGTSFDNQLHQFDPDVYVKNTARQPTSQPVGGRFSFRVEVGVQGLPGATATRIVLESELPEGLLIARYGVDETFIPFENACAVVTASSYRCDWPLLQAPDVRVIEVTAIGRQAGSYSITATVRTASTDNNPENNESTAQIQVLGACCDRQTSIPKCQDVLGSTDCPSGSTFIPNQSCQRSRCEENNTGACCLTWGSCVDQTYPPACQAANGTWHAKTACSALRKQGLCKAARGACCNVRDGQCYEDVAVSECDLKSSTWWVGGHCASDGYCSGACCDSQQRYCYQSKKVDCQAPTQSWSLYGQCDPFTCPVGDACTPAWHKCKPGQLGGGDECCPGHACAEAPSGSKVGKFVCQPKFGLTCGTEGMACGGKSSAVCCEGYVCWWDESSNKGHCWPQPDSDTCAQDGSNCNHDRDCCYGSRCYLRHNRKSPGGSGLSSKPSWAELLPAVGHCAPVSLEKCHKDCFDYECFVERQRDCNALYATAAARPSFSS